MQKVILENPEKILLIRTDRIGDLVTTTPAIRAVRKKFPEAKIDFLASNLNHLALAANPYLDNIYVLHHKHFWTWPLLVHRLRKQKYDAIICFNGFSSKAAFFSAQAGGRQSFGLTKAKYAKYFNHPFTADQHMHATIGNLNFLELIGIPDDGVDMDYFVPAGALSLVDSSYPKPAGSRRIAVFIGNAKKVDTRWPTDKFAELVGRLLAGPILKENPNSEIFLIYGPLEEPFLEMFPPHPQLKKFKGNLVELGAFLKSCDFLVTSSSGPWHISAAVGTPTIGIISKFNYDCWRPLGESHRFVRLDSGEKDIRPIPVDAVYKEIESFLNASRKTD